MKSLLDLLWEDSAEIIANSEIEAQTTNDVLSESPQTCLVLSCNTAGGPVPGDCYAPALAGLSGVGCKP